MKTKVLAFKFLQKILGLSAILSVVQN